MQIRSWVLIPLLAIAAGCQTKNDETVEPTSNHGETLTEPAKGKFPWGPPAPEAPLTPSPVPQLPEQTKSPMNPGDGTGPKAEDKLVPKTTADSATPK